MSSRKSRFWLHYVMGGDPAARLAALLRERFPEDAVIEASPMDLPPGLEAAARTLMVGVGPGGTDAARLQEGPLRGASLLAFCPPPGIACTLLHGPRAVVYGSRSGVYGTLPLGGRLFAGMGARPPAQMYGLPHLVHGPALALYALAYLAGAYMEAEDLSRAVMDIAGPRRQ